MRRETKIRAIERLISRRRTASAAEEAASAAATAISDGDRQRAEEAAGVAWAAGQVAAAADDAWRSLSREQREFATRGVSAAEALGYSAARRGGRYSGHTDWSALTWGETTAARTTTSRGDQYSRRCTYRRLDARHEVTLTVEGTVDLIDAPALAAASEREGLPLISYCAATGAAVWVALRGKAIRAQRGWIATAGEGAGAVIYHSTESLDHARRGASRKAGAAAREAERIARDRATETRADRRARLVVRLCGGATATVGDALRAGYCRPGIAAWQQRHGIGDSAPLAALVATGDPLATRLAFDLARRLRRDRRAAAATEPAAV